MMFQKVDQRTGETVETLCYGTADAVSRATELSAVVQIKIQPQNRADSLETDIVATFDPAEARRIAREMIWAADRAERQAEQLKAEWIESVNRDRARNGVPAYQL